MSRLAVCAGLLGLLLAGCAHDGGPAVPPPIAPEPKEPASEAAPLPPPPPPPEPEPERLIGWRPGEVAELFGRPALVRWEGPAQLYLYRAADGSCALLLAFREDGRGYALTALAAHDPNDPAHSPVDQTTCLKHVLPERLWPRLAPAARAARDASPPAVSGDEEAAAPASLPSVPASGGRAGRCGDAASPEGKSSCPSPPAASGPPG